MNWKKRIGLYWGLAFCVTWNAHATKWSHASIAPELEKRAIRYFVENSHPNTGLVRDRAPNFAEPTPDNMVASMAATGFGLSVFANAAARGLVDRGFAENYAEKVLRFSAQHVRRHNGWFLHFVNWQTGKRVGNSEYSTIDTALFIAGALHAAQVFPGGEVARLANQLYEELDFFDMLTQGGTKPDSLTLSMGYIDGAGYIPTQWHMYAEQMILILLGLGHPTRPLPTEVWYAWDRSQMELPDGSAQVMGLNEALFTHQYSQLFVDFRTFDDGYKNYFTNSVEVTRYHRRLRELDFSFKTLREGFWGFSAGDAPGDEYRVYSAINYEGTVCVGCALGSLMFMPREILTDASDWLNGPHHKDIWGRYGFTDSLNLDENWFGAWVLGITVGPIYLSLANTNEETSVWREFMSIPAMQSALNRIGQLRAQKPSLVSDNEMIQPGPNFLDRPHAKIAENL